MQGDERNITVYERGNCFLTCATRGDFENKESVCRNADFGLGPGRPATFGINPTLKAALNTTSEGKVYLYYVSAR